MEQAKEVIPVSRNTNYKLVSVGNIASAILVVIALARIFIWGTRDSFDVILLTPAALMMTYNSVIFYNYFRWMNCQNKISHLLNMADYEGEMFSKDEHNYFEVMFLRFNDYELDLRRYAKNGGAEGRAWSEARNLANQAKEHLESIQIILNEVDQIDRVFPSDEADIHRKLAKDNFEAAAQTISGIRKRNREREAKVEEVKNKASEAHCLRVILNHFKEEGFDLKAAEMLILKCRQVRSQAKEYGIEKKVTAELENGDLEEARKMILAAKEERRKAAQKRRELEAIDNRIETLDYADQPALRIKRNRLRDEEHNSKEYRSLWRDIDKALKEKESG